jgi:hypothetical protein
MSAGLARPGAEAEVAVPAQRRVLDLEGLGVDRSAGTVGIVQRRGCKMGRAEVADRAFGAAGEVLGLVSLCGLEFGGLERDQSREWDRNTVR